MERALESKLLEQDWLMAKGFQKKVEVLKEEMQNLKEGIEITRQREQAAQREALMSMGQVLSGGVQSYMDYKIAREGRKVEKYRIQQAEIAHRQGTQHYHGSRPDLPWGGGLKQGVPGQGGPNLSNHQQGKPNPGQTQASSSTASTGTQESSSKSSVRETHTFQP
ncbi:hypothetical protein SKAU_G00416900 [Synaphobranchus kaupii]|uniref:Uncharacterized protein n=1 Tax=Synaphobranchus kaupii TaxID=118154 RepID=A0A9Q1E5X8_SYNKA|nr:hypothetical protein SKAU_G00416900 [Synaphobranchus kaupii]